MPSLNFLVQYNVFTLVFSWFALANLWLTFSIIIDLLPDEGLVLFGGDDHTGLDIVSLFFLIRYRTERRYLDTLG